MSIYFDETGQEHQKPDDINLEWRISGYALIQSDEKRFLMVQPTWNKSWELPGGGIEKEESIKEGIVRECYEETGYKIRIHEQPIFVGERNFFSKAINTVEKNEIANVSWVQSEELNQSNVHPIVWPAISKLLKG